MITEDYVSFETAKLLKEKGFDEPCNSFYEYKKKLYIHDMDKYFPNGMKNSDHDKENNKGISAPTLQMAMKWLREVHNIDIFPWKIGKGIYSCAIFNSNTGQDLSSNKDFPSEKYEVTCEAAIKYCLENLI